MPMWCALNSYNLHTHVAPHWPMRGCCVLPSVFVCPMLFLFMRTMATNQIAWVLADERSSIHTCIVITALSGHCWRIPWMLRLKFKFVHCGWCNRQAFHATICNAMKSLQSWPISGDLTISNCLEKKRTTAHTKCANGRYQVHRFICLWDFVFVGHCRRCRCSSNLPEWHFSLISINVRNWNKHNLSPLRNMRCTLPFGKTYTIISVSQRVLLEKTVWCMQKQITHHISQAVVWHTEHISDGCRIGP